MRQYDWGTTIEFHIKNEDGTCFDLQNFEVKLLFLKPNQNEPLIKDVEMINPIQGHCSYTIDQGDLDVSGTYKLQLVIRGADMKIYTDIMQIKVEPSLKDIDW